MLFQRVASNWGFGVRNKMLKKKRIRNKGNAEWSFLCWILSAGNLRFKKFLGQGLSILHKYLALYEAIYISGLHFCQWILHYNYVFCERVFASVCFKPATSKFQWVPFRSCWGKNEKSFPIHPAHVVYYTDLAHVFPFSHSFPDPKILS